MNVPPGYNQQPSAPPGYGQPQGYYPPPGPVPASGSYVPPPPPPHHHHGFRGATRQFFNPAAYRQPGTGAFGTSSLILSLVSLVLFCGLLSPISLILGFVGLIGQKTHKGAALAGFLISALQVGFWAAVVGFGAHQVMFKEKYANQAGAPVVAAIEEYKKDHNGTVPPTLDELVTQGYLPARWTSGLDDLDSAVKSQVEGKEWKEFLQYTASGYSPNVTTTSTPRRGPKGKGEIWVDDDSHDMPVAPVITSKTYTLRYIGVDGAWYTTDDQDCSQNPEKKFDLSSFGGGNKDSLKQLTQTKRELNGTLKDLDGKIARYNTEIPKEEARLRDSEDKLKKLIREKNLKNLAAVKADNVGKERLALIGEIKTRIAAYTAKLKQLRETRELVGIQMERIEGQESMAKMAESKEELVKLQQILDDAKAKLGKADDTSDFMGDDKEAQAAEEWYNDFTSGRGD